MQMTILNNTECCHISGLADSWTITDPVLFNCWCGSGFRAGKEQCDDGNLAVNGLVGGNIYTEGCNTNTSSCPTSNSPLFGYSLRTNDGCNGQSTSLDFALLNCTRRVLSGRVKLGMELLQRPSTGGWRMEPRYLCLRLQLQLSVHLSGCKAKDPLWNKRRRKQVHPRAAVGYHLLLLILVSVEEQG
mmetsp:Transcript_12338/g.42969  ORF Transcript_12338/g.42969 Transcript_12338/m.42969 type:complete len:187 (-) Transcript_12338:177-737(-)